MNDALVKKIRQCPTLPSLPSIAIQVLEMAQSEQADIAEIARIISKDPALSSKILRTVNSSFYGRSQSISTISHALVILGLQSVKTLVLGFSLVNNLSKTKSRGFKHIIYWRRSVYAATAARLLAIKLQVVQQEECFLAGLLQDIGMLVLDQVLGEPYGEVHEQAPSHRMLCEAEQAAIQMTHAEVSGLLADQWKLPPVLSVPMAFHHRPEAVSDPVLRKLTEVVSLASACADVFVDEQPADAIASVRKTCGQLYNIGEVEADQLLDEICTRTKEVAPLFEIAVVNQSYEAIVKKANETLVELTLKMQQQAANLEQQNAKLKEAATVDALTGLANRSAFDQFVAQQFEASVAAGKPMSMLLIDIDRFKLVNDKHGHPAGDAVLRAVGKLLKSAARAQDLSARYGGEEMSLVMPGTTRVTAAAIAESIRRAICAKPMVIDGAEVPITISIGVATLEEGMPFKLPAHLIKAADLAVYAAKHGGRNCVKVFSLKAPAAVPAQPAAAVAPAA
jgi:two-component system, cell cycle response regulator